MLYRSERNKKDIMGKKRFFHVEFVVGFRKEVGIEVIEIIIFF